MRLPLLAIALSVALLGGLGAQAAAAPNDGPNDFNCKLLRAALHGTQVGSDVPHYGGYSGGCEYFDGRRPGEATWVTFLTLKYPLAAEAHALLLRDYQGRKKTM